MLLDLKPYCKLVATTHSSAFAVAHKHTLTGEGERMAITLFSVPTPHQSLCTRRSLTNCNSRFHSSTTLIQYPSKSNIIPLSSSSSSPSTSVVEDGPTPPSDALPATDDVDKLPLRYFLSLLLAVEPLIFLLCTSICLDANNSMKELVFDVNFILGPARLLAQLSNQFVIRYSRGWGICNISFLYVVCEN